MIVKTHVVDPQAAPPNSSLMRSITLVGVVLVAVIIWLIPQPVGVQARAWHLFAIFVATIVGIIVKPLPMGAIAMLGIGATALTGTLTISQAQRDKPSDLVCCGRSMVEVARALVSFHHTLFRLSRKTVGAWPAIFRNTRLKWVNDWKPTA